ncbi:MAG: potassium transporter TrkA [Sulfurospirillaceae bacterium]|nr:potassium transporter TrkA [Sulfurospirillaceae bacterium]
MKKILIIASGILAKQFLERVIDNDTGENNYTLITCKKDELPKKLPENFKAYHFDPTSFEKLALVFNDQYFQAMVMMSKKMDTLVTYKNIRLLDKKIQIIIMSKWDLEIDDKRVFMLDSREILASRLKDHIPGVPVVAQNVGLGIGEVMEISVPIGSSYVYRHVASIEQKKWKIAAIYRANTLILPRPTLMILPNDVLLTVGDPIVLQSVFRSVKKELGQFPSPFGSSIYCLIDMFSMSEKKIDTLLNDAFLLHAKINNKKLYIKVINPTFSKVFMKIKSYENSHISVTVDYYETSIKKTIAEDARRLDIGLIVVNSSFFSRYIKTLYNTKIPVLKIGTKGFLNLNEGIILTGDSDEIEKESSVIFDLSKQLDLKVKLYDYNPENDFSKSNLAEHFENLSKLFGRDVEIVGAQKNPLIKLRSRDDILQFLPFSVKILDSNIFSIFSTDMEKLYFKLSDNYQLFIPVTT